jgi:8-oxo-dGTP pyrophosphatase MutT (NUDIX family)
MIYHPKLDEHGKTVVLSKPSKATPITAWSNPLEVATAVPGSELPQELNRIPFAEWLDAPRSPEAWERLADYSDIAEPTFSPLAGKKPAAGVVIEEADGRVWLVAPSNAFGGYAATFPKGTVEPGASRQATAIKEALEEAGLHVELAGYLADSDRSLSYTRYYRARRIGGNPASMGWESQAVHLVPRDRLADYLTHKNDQPLLKALLAATSKLAAADILRSSTLSSGHRIRQAVDGYRSRYGKWPIRVLMDGEMADAIKQHTLTDMGWAMLVSKLEIVRISEGRVIVEGESGERFEYGEIYDQVPAGKSADVWIWGCNLA